MSHSSKSVAKFYKILIFFQTMIPIDKRPSPSVAQHWYASACQMSLQYVQLFHRR